MMENNEMATSGTDTDVSEMSTLRHLHGCKYREEEYADRWGVLATSMRLKEEHGNRRNRGKDISEKPVVVEYLKDQRETLASMLKQINSFHDCLCFTETESIEIETKAAKRKQRNQRGTSSENERRISKRLNSQKDISGTEDGVVMPEIQKAQISKTLSLSEDDEPSPSPSAVTEIINVSGASSLVTEVVTEILKGGNQPSMETVGAEMVGVDDTPCSDNVVVRTEKLSYDDAYISDGEIEKILNEEEEDAPSMDTEILNGGNSLSTGHDMADILNEGYQPSTEAIETEMLGVEDTRCPDDVDMRMEKMSEGDDAESTKILNDEEEPSTGTESLHGGSSLPNVVAVVTEIVNEGHEISAKTVGTEMRTVNDTHCTDDVDMRTEEMGEDDDAEITKILNEETELNTDTVMAEVLNENNAPSTEPATTEIPREDCDSESTDAVVKEMPRDEDSGLETVM